MYGSVARASVKPGAANKLAAWGEQQPTVKGEIALFVYQADNDPNEMWMCSVFESKEAYFANANDPAQHQRFLQMMQFLEAEPEWHDGEIIFSQMGRAASSR